MRRKPGGKGLPAWLAAALARILGPDGEWAVGDLEERERTRRARGRSSTLRLAGDVGSALAWGLSWRIRRAAGAAYLFLDELRLAARSLLRRPGYATGVVVTLSLGIGTVAAAFTVVDGVVLRPLPFGESEQLFRLHRTDDLGGQDLDFSAAQVETLSRTTAARGGMGAFSRAGRVLRPGRFGEGQPRSVGFARVTEGFLETLGVSPHLGRLFDPAEVRDGAPVVVLSEELWRRVFGGDPSVVGSVIHLDEVRHRIVGVLPTGLGFPEDALLWRPLTRDERLDDDPELVVVARLPKGISRTVFESVLDVSVDGARADAPATWQDFRARAVPLRDAVLGASVPRVLLVLLAASALVLLVALTNAAGLQLLRALEARDDASVRIALGASVSRVVRGLLTETLLLAAAALTLGLAMAAAGLPAIRALAPGAVPRLGSVELDLRVGAAVAAVTFLGALAGGLPPALSVARRSMIGIRRSAVSGGLRLRTLRTLVAVQLGLTTVLLISAGLLSVSLRRMLDVPRGFDAEHLVTIPLALSSATGELGAFQRDLLERVERIPGVTTAAVSIGLPGFGTGMNLEMIGVGNLPVAPGETRPAYLHTVSPSFFETVRLPILEGRPLPTDRIEGGGAAVVNQAFARAFLGPRPWVGQRFTRSGAGVDERLEMEVVGGQRRHCYGSRRSASAVALRVYRGRTNLQEPARTHRYGSAAERHLGAHSRGDLDPRSGAACECDGMDHRRTRAVRCAHAFPRAPHGRLRCARAFARRHRRVRRRCLRRVPASSGARAEACAWRPTQWGAGSSARACPWHLATGHCVWSCRRVGYLAASRAAPIRDLSVRARDLSCRRGWSGGRGAPGRARAGRAHGAR